MGWFKQMIVQWLNEDQSPRKIREYEANAISCNDDSGESANGDAVLNFRVYSAVGGRIVEFRRYDRKSGDNQYTSYIITEDQDFGDRIARIATMENLKS